MTDLEEKKSSSEIVIPISTRDELVKYQKGLMNLLRTVNVNGCDVELKESIKAIYELLSHFQVERNFRIRHKH